MRTDYPEAKTDTSTWNYSTRSVGLAAFFLFRCHRLESILPNPRGDSRQQIFAFKPDEGIDADRQRFLSGSARVNPLCYWRIITDLNKMARVCARRRSSYPE